MRTTSSGSLWRIIGLSAVLSALLLLAGFGYAVKDMLYPKGEVYAGSTRAPSLPAGGQVSLDKEISITAIGDSLTKGTGDSTGEGYVKQTIAMLKAKHPDIPVRLNNNLAVNGLKADKLAALLETDKGYRYALKQANVILFTIGGNDLFQFASGEKGTSQSANEKTENADDAADGLDLDKLNSEIPTGLQRFEKIARSLHDLNPNARVIYVGLYNPFYDIADYRSGSLQIQDWNEQVYAKLQRYPNMSLIPTFDLFEGTIGRYLSSDHFHPNHSGYAQIAARIVQSLP